MIIRRLTLHLPARLKSTAQHDARKIAHTVAQAVFDSNGHIENVALQGHGQDGSVLAQRVGIAAREGKTYGC